MNDAFSLYSNAEEKYILKFGTRDHSVDAFALAKALVSCRNNIVSAAKFIKGMGGVSVRVEAIEKGSVEVHLAINVQSDNSNEASVSEVIQVLSEMKDVYSFLAAKPLSGVELIGDGNVELTNFNGARKTISRVAYMTLVDSMEPPLGVCPEDSDESPISISLVRASDRVSVLSISSDEFKTMTSDVLKLGNVQPQERIESCFVRIATIPIDAPRNSWQLVYQGNKISAQILDEGFIAKIEQHALSFSKGDELEVQLKKSWKVDAVTAKTSFCKFTINKVVNIRRQPKATDLPGF